MRSKLSQLKPETLDRIEKYTLCVIFAVFAYRMIAGYLETGSPVTLIYLFDQCIILGFLMVRRATKAISTRIDDWIIGFAGTFLALLFGPASGNPILPMPAIVGLMLLGMVCHLSAKLILRRSFGVVAANRGVKKTGPYRLVRHPMYTGYMLTQLGLVLSGPTLNNVAIAGLCWALFIWRIVAEERVLGNDPAYASLPRFRLVPGVY